MQGSTSPYISIVALITFDLVPGVKGPKPTSLPPHPPFRRLRFRIAPPRPRPSPSSSSRPLLRRVAALLGGRVRASHRLLSSSPSSAAAAAAERASPPSPADPDTVHMTDGCIRRLKELHAKEPPSEGKMLRLSVEAGGCSGLQYSFSLDVKKNSDDR
ncbi:hypothetical protein OsI_28975 [Oryza sativa Indica Group]|uniref:FeS cluster biogenesis domain-containing protein n=1 Tax=Oryza sativa subsp. indica TaxID=39946 RepID=B8BAB5_ORYSI|nr:hypothetical protein OsI_28975 [Oryza sativa Indica Group]